jgi:hypothetical protein
MQFGDDGMTHRQKIDRLIEELRPRGVRPRMIAPPIFRLLWAMGLEVPPPLFLGFVSLAVLSGITFAVLFMALGGVLLWLVFWQGLPFATVVLRMLVMGAIAGPLYGLYVAWFCRREAARLGLPSLWKDYAAS